MKMSIVLRRWKCTNERISRSCYKSWLSFNIYNIFFLCTLRWNIQDVAEFFFQVGSMLCAVPCVVGFILFGFDFSFDLILKTSPEGEVWERQRAREPFRLRLLVNGTRSRVLQASTTLLVLEDLASSFHRAGRGHGGGHGAMQRKACLLGCRCQ
jgi:hypothetical protein